jgi:hypothetical protein
MDQDSESDDDDIIDDIADQEDPFMDEPKEHNRYYLGSCKLIRPDNYYLMLCAVSNRIFLQYPAHVVTRYLESASLIYVHLPTIDIMKLEVLPDQTYTVVKKTFWIRLVQRCWRSVLRNRLQARLRRGSIMAQRTFEMTGRWPIGLNVLPGLCGMMKGTKVLTSHAV